MDDATALANLHEPGQYRDLAVRATDPDVLRRLAACAYPFVRTAVARNPATPLDALAVLVATRHAEYHDNELLLLLARSPRTTGEVLARTVAVVTRDLSDGRRPYAAAITLAGRPDVDPAAVRAFAAVASRRLRRGLTNALAARASGYPSTEPPECTFPADADALT